MSKFYIVRDDSKYCATVNCTTFVKSFSDILRKYTDATVIIIDVYKQIAYVDWYLREYYKDHTIVSLDKWYLGDYQLQVSRVFDLKSEQKSALRIKTDFDHQVIKKLQNSNKPIILVDDDIASGFTIKQVTDILFELGIYVSDYISMAKIYYHGDIEDYVDIRDFIPNALHGGLLCTDNHQLSRHMYLHPTVNLCTRMKLSEENAVKFTQDVKQLIEKEFNYVC